MLRKILIISMLALASCLSANAQKIGDNQSVYRKGGDLFSADGDRIDRSTALNYMSSETYYEYYLKGHRPCSFAGISCIL